MLLLYLYIACMTLECIQVTKPQVESVCLCSVCFNTASTDDVQGDPMLLKYDKMKH